MIANGEPDPHRHIARVTSAPLPDDLYHQERTPPAGNFGNAGGNDLEPFAGFFQRR